MPPVARGGRAAKTIAKKGSGGGASARISGAHWASLFDRATKETEHALRTIHSARKAAAAAAAADGEDQDAKAPTASGAGSGEGWVDMDDSDDEASGAGGGGARRSARRGAVDVRSMWDAFQQGRRAQEREARAQREREQAQQEQMKQEQLRAVESAAEAEARKKREREEQRAADRARREAERMGTGIDMMGQANLMKSFESGGGGGAADDFSMDSFG